MQRHTIATVVAVFVLVPLISFGLMSLTSPSTTPITSGLTQPTPPTTQQSTTQPTANPTANPTTKAPTATPTLKLCYPTHLKIRQGETKTVDAPIVQARVTTTTVEVPKWDIGFFRYYHRTKTGFPGEGKVVVLGGHVLRVEQAGAPLKKLHESQEHDDVVIQCDDGSSRRYKLVKLLTVAAEEQYRTYAGESTFDEAMFDLIEKADKEIVLITTCAGDKFTAASGEIAMTHRTIGIAEIQ
jgi:hypothetical protein